MVDAYIFVGNETKDKSELALDAASWSSLRYTLLSLLLLQIIVLHARAKRSTFHVGSQ